MKKNMHKEKKKHKKNSKKRKQVGILFVLIGVLLILVFGFGEYQSYKSAIEIRKLQQLKEASSDNGNGIDTSKILPEYRNLYKTNSDLVGWLVVNGTQINYPVVQSTVYQEFYLDHNFDGEDDESGAVFADARNDVFKPDDNVILYGHNMKNGTMFGSLHQYLDAAYMKEHQYVYVVTPEEELIYQVFAAVEYDDRHILQSFSFTEAYGREAYLDSLRKNDGDNDYFREDVEATENDRLLTLSTCIKNESEKRLLVEAVLVNESER